MRVTVTQDAPCPPAALFAWVEDLRRYPSWLGLAHRVEAAGARPGDPGPAWVVDLRGRFGPLARSKRLRMVRVEHVEGRRAAFERREADGRRHSSWRMDVRVEPTEGGARLEMRLDYDGALWGPVLDHVLREEIDRGRPRLLALARGDVSGGEPRR